MTFEEMHLPEYLLRGLREQGFTAPTPIQAACVPAITDGQDVVGLSQTGSGKTYAFGLPLIARVDEDPYVQVLVVCPTRELTVQVTEQLRLLTAFRESARIVPVFGGSSIDRQILALRKNARIVVGTPGRLCDHLRRKTLKLKHVKAVVLDEADEMLDMGFRPDIEQILQQTNPQRQTVMFSATMPDGIRRIAETYMREPQIIGQASDNRAQTFIRQYSLAVDRKQKTAALLRLLAERNPARALVFCNTKGMVDELQAALAAQSLRAEGLHGDMRQRERREALQAFKEGESAYLVATDVAARGLDISDVDAVINYDVPADPAFYVHRIGRTARAGKTGDAYSLVCGRKQSELLQAIVRQTGNEIEPYACEWAAEVAPADKKEKRRGGNGAPDRRRQSGTDAYEKKRAAKPYNQRRGPEKSYAKKGGKARPQTAGARRTSAPKQKPRRG